MEVKQAWKVQIFFHLCFLIFSESSNITILLFRFLHLYFIALNILLWLVDLCKIVWRGKMHEKLKNSIYRRVLYEHFLMVTPTLPGSLGKDVVTHQNIHPRSFFFLESWIENITFFDYEIYVFFLLNKCPMIWFIWICILLGFTIDSFPFGRFRWRFRGRGNNWRLFLVNRVLIALDINENIHFFLLFILLYIMKTD